MDQETMGTTDAEITESSSSSSSGSSNTSTSSSTSQSPSSPPTDTKPTDNKPEKLTTRSAAREALDEIRKKASGEAAKAEGTKPGTRTVEQPVKTDATKPAAAAPTDTKPVPTDTTKPAINAPQSIPASLREDWAKIPREYQEYIAKRDTEATQKLAQLGPSAKFGNEVRAHAKDLMPLLKERNIDLSTFTKESFQTAYNLAAGNPQQRAAVIANMIRLWQPDPKALQAILGGKAQPPAAPRPPVDFEAEVNKRLEARQKTEMESATKKSVDTFYTDPKNEFVYELDSQIGAAITGGFVQWTNPDGTQKSYAQILKEAYEFALKNSEQHQSILARRGQSNGTPAIATDNPNAGKPAVRQAAPSAGGGAALRPAPKKYATTREAARDALAQIRKNKK
jgi:hypothetical protein